MNKPLVILNKKPIFPTSGTHEILIGKQPSILSFDYVMKNSDKSLILGISKADIGDEIKDFNNLYFVGLRVKIIDYLRQDQNNVKVFFNIESRVNIINYTKENDINFVEFEEYKDDIPTQAVFLNWSSMIMENAKSLEPYYLEYSGMLSNLLSYNGSIVDKIFSISDNIFQDRADRITILQSSLIEIMEKITVDSLGKLSIANMKRKIEDKTKDTLNEKQYKFWLREQISVIQDEINGVDSSSKSIKYKIENEDLPDYVKEALLKEEKELSESPGFSSDAAARRSYIDWLLSLPWNKSKQLDFDSKKASDIINDSHYGLEEVKEKIINIINLNEHNPNKTPRPILLVGSPGVGKTSICKVIAEATSRKLIRVSLAGEVDPNRLHGHSRTYVASTPGIFIKKIKEAGVNNPIFQIDEIDKTFGEKNPLFVLLDILDTDNKCSFEDHYIGLPFYFDKTFFILTANSIDNLPSTILNRVNVIRIPCYSKAEKLEISKKIVQKALEENNISNDIFEITSDAVEIIIDKYTRESGMRQFSRRIDDLILEAFKRYKIFGEKIIVNEENISLFLKRPILGYSRPNDIVGVANGMYYTEMGGGAGFFEFTKYKKDPIRPVDLSFCLNGTNVTKESAGNALVYIKTIADKLGIAYLINEYTIHVSMFGAANGIDGPSAGIAMSIGIFSLLLDIPFPHNVTITGEISAKGDYLPIGGVKEKITGSLRDIPDLKCVFIPHLSYNEDVPSGIKVFEAGDQEILKYFMKELIIIKCKHVTDVLRYLWLDNPIIKDFLEKYNTSHI